MWPDGISNPGHLPLESARRATDYSTCVCVCVCVYVCERGDAYTVMSPVGNSPLKKMIVIFFLGQKLLHVRGKASIPFERLSRRYSYLHASENSVMQNKTR